MDWVNLKGTKELPEGLSVSRLVYEVYDHHQREPEKWLARLVADDASQQGCGQIDWTGRPYFRPDAKHASQLEQEWETLVALSHRLTKQHPGLSHILNEQIEAGIMSRRRTERSYSS
jgi:hypothetical protein